MSLRTSLVAVLSVLAAACSSSGGSSSTPAGNQGVTGPGDTGGTVEKNSYGVPYPTKNIGTEARSGSRPGNIMRNFKFQGYKTQMGQTVTPNGQLTQVSLADYFDPQQKNGFKVLHITVSSVWCNPCNEETKEMVAAAPDLASKGVLFLQALNDGPAQGVGATPLDLDGWVKKHQVNFPQVLDPSLKNFGGFFDAAAVPFNADLDLRSMEILSAGVGAPPDIAAEVEKWTAWVDKNPAQATE